MKKKKSDWSFSMKKSIALFFLLGLALAGCGGLSYDEQVEAKFWATQNAEYGVIPPAKYQTLAATALNLRLTATPQGTPTPNPNWTPTMSFYDHSATQAAQVQNNAMTAQVQQQQFELKKLQAEQAAEQARLEAQAHSDQMTAQAAAVALQSTQSAYGTMVANTAIAQSTATERALVMQAAGTGTAAVLTAVVQPTMDVLTLQAARIVQTVEAGEAEKVALAVRRQTMKNTFDAYLPWTLTLALAYVFGRGFATWVKTRTHARDEHGRTPTLTRELPDGSVVITNVDQLETGVVKIGANGEVVRYAPMDEKEQSHINHGKMLAEIAGQLPVGQIETVKNLLAKFAGGQNTAPARIVVSGTGALKSAIEEADQKLLEEA
jgi:hypothetical protein